MSKKTNNQQKNVDDMSFMEHIGTLRWHLIRAAIVIAFLSIIAFFFKNFIFDDILIAPKNDNFLTNRLLCSMGKRFGLESLCLNNHAFILMNIELAGQFALHMKISFMTGIIVSMPYVLWELWRFLKPALKQKEIKYSKGLIYIISLLFILGIVFGYYLIVPFSINFLGNYFVSSQVVNQIDINSFISTVTMLLLSTGLTFEMPVVIYFLTKLNIISPKYLKKYRRHAIVIIFIIAGIITPPDVLSQILVGIPLYLLYEASIGVSTLVIFTKSSSEK